MLYCISSWSLLTVYFSVMFDSEYTFFHRWKFVISKAGSNQPHCFQANLLGSLSVHQQKRVNNTETFLRTKFFGRRYTTYFAGTTCLSGFGLIKTELYGSNAFQDSNLKSM